MASVELKNINNETIGQIEINDDVLSYPVKPWLFHEVVVMQLANKRAGTHSTLNRAKIVGGGRKPWKQKGTGRARAGSNLSPLWRGGAITFGPQPRDYSYSMPKKKIKNALKSAIRSRFDEKTVSIVDSFNIESGKTKDAVQAVKKFNADRKVLLVYGSLTENAERAFRNIPYVKMLNVKGLNVYDLLNANFVIIDKEGLAHIMEVLG